MSPLLLLPIVAAVLAAPSEIPSDTPALAVARPALRLSVETDVLDPLLLQFWSAFVSLQPASFGHFRVRLGGGGGTAPTWLAESGGNRGWAFRFNVVSLCGQYVLGDDRGGFYLTGVAALEFTHLTGPSGGTVDVMQAHVQAGGGYRWYPFAQLGLVINPSLSAYVNVARDRSPTVDGQTFQQPLILPAPELLIGYEFDLGGRAR